MIFLIIYLSALIAAVVTGVMCARSDVKTMTIPNEYVLVVLGSAVVGEAAGYFSGVEMFGSIKSYALSGLVTFCVTYLLFVFKFFGGGDAKLITAFSFWFKLSVLIDLLFYCAVLGAVMGAFSLFVNKKKPFKSPDEKSWIGRTQKGERVVAYGLPIVVSAFIVLVAKGYFSLDLLKSFLL